MTKGEEKLKKVEMTARMIALLLDGCDVESSVALYALLRVIRGLVANNYIHYQHAMEYLESTRSKLPTDAAQLMNRPASGLFDPNRRQLADSKEGT